ncbi:NAD-dependent epimerase/dehydratase family protein [Prolixibacteraceae bacterium JC049]|nr:NAD-dependent epimerase/dehydratase family protein [Prolixibacteraceae bacterium JC049]
MKKMIINGANGYVASNFIVELLQHNYQVVALVRSNKKLSARERMEQVLLEMNDGQQLPFENLMVFDYSLFEENFALQPEQLEAIFSEEADYFHFAASLKFDIKSKEEIFSTNLQGVTNSVNTFKKYSPAASRFFFVSTAYSCGQMNDVFEERFYDDAEIDSFRNYYEQSKRYAENMIRKFRDEEQLNAHILRLSQIVGNNQNGVTKTDYGIFDFSKRIQNIALKYPDSTVRLRINPESTQNLLPIDILVNYLMDAVRAEELPVILNMVAKQSVRNADIMNSLGKLLPIKLIPEFNIQHSEMTLLERIIDAGMAFTGAYIDINLKFDTTKLDGILNAQPSKICAESIHQMLDYFLNEQATKKYKKAMS